MSTYIRSKAAEHKDFADHWLSAMTKKKGVTAARQAAEVTEIKYGQPRATGNIFVEIRRKNYATDPTWEKSGIWRENKHWYLIGNEQCFYVFQTAALRAISSNFREKEGPTWCGILIPCRVADGICTFKGAIRHGEIVDMGEVVSVTTITTTIQTQKTAVIPIDFD